jgi:hypothetical protein
MSNIQEMEGMDEDEELKTNFWPFVDKDDYSCWEWTGGKDSDGYGRVKYEGKRQQAHKLSYIIHFGEVPKGLIVARTCNNKLCVNPSHLELRTQSENSKKAPRSFNFVRLSENGKQVFQFVDLDDKPVNDMIDDNMSMEILRGHANTSKSQSIRNAIAFYHAALSRGLTHEHDEQALHQISAWENEHTDQRDADQ